MELYEKLEIKKIKTINIPKWGTYLRKQWEDNFANHLSPQEKNIIMIITT